MRIGNIKFRVFEFSAAAVLAVGLIHLADRAQEENRKAMPASAWFEINSVFVPDFDYGTNPTLTYDRAIKEPFRGFWVVEVQQRDPGTGGFVLRCSGSGINDYEPQDYIPENLVTWNWFIGGRCPDLPPGSYRIRISWVLKKPNWPEKQTVAYSNLFTIRPRS